MHGYMLMKNFLEEILHEKGIKGEIIAYKESQIYKIYGFKEDTASFIVSVKEGRNIYVFFVIIFPLCSIRGETYFYCMTKTYNDIKRQIGKKRLKEVIIQDELSEANSVLSRAVLKIIYKNVGKKLIFNVHGLNGKHYLYCFSKLYDMSTFWSRALCMMYPATPFANIYIYEAKASDIFWRVVAGEKKIDGKEKLFIGLSAQTHYVLPGNFHKLFSEMLDKIYRTHDASHITISYKELMNKYRDLYSGEVF